MRGANPPVRANSVLGRLPLLLLWAIGVGLFLRFASPYRYVEAKVPYPWDRLAMAVAALTVETFVIYILLRATPAGKTRGLWLAALSFAVLFVLNLALFYRSFHSPPDALMPALFAMLGFIVFTAFAIGAEVVMRVRRRRSFKELP